MFKIKPMIAKLDFKKHFFEELDKVKPPLSLSVKSYLIDLLLDFLRSDELHKKEGSLEKGLLNLYNESQNSPPQKSIFLLKKIGDFSLYMGGFFRSSFKDKLVSVSYYEEFGRHAYKFVSSSYDSKNVFTELAQDFRALCMVLFSIQKNSEEASRLLKDKPYLLASMDKALKDPQNSSSS